LPRWKRAIWNFRGKSWMWLLLWMNS